MSDQIKQKAGITDDLLVNSGFQKVVKENGLILFSKGISGTASDFIIMKSEVGLFSAPQVHTPGKILNDFISSDGQDILHSMDEVNSYYHKAIMKLRS